jgi:hypothetical protein
MRKKLTSKKVQNQNNFPKTQEKKKQRKFTLLNLSKFVDFPLIINLLKVKKIHLYKNTKRFFIAFFMFFHLFQLIFLCSLNYL